MNSMIAFDTLAFAKRLREAGYNDKQAEGMAEAHVEVFQRMLDSTLATKNDIRDVKDEIQEVRTELKAEIQELRTELKAEIQELRTEIRVLDTKIDALGMQLTIRLGVMMAASIGIAVTLMKMH